MAHIGRIYEYADNRDFCIVTTPMLWLPKRFVIRENRRMGEAGNPPTDGNWFSNEPIIDVPNGEHLYEWEPGGWENFPLTLWYKVSCTQAFPNPRRYELGWTYKGVSNNRVIESLLVGEDRIPNLFIALQLGLGTGEGITITSNDFQTAEAARWTDI